MVRALYCNLTCLSKEAWIELGALEELDSDLSSHNAELVGIRFLEQLAIYSFFFRAEV